MDIQVFVYLLTTQSVGNVSLRGKVGRGRIQTSYASGYFKQGLMELGTSCIDHVDRHIRIEIPIMLR